MRGGGARRSSSASIRSEAAADRPQLQGVYDDHLAVVDPAGARARAVIQYPRVRITRFGIDLAPGVHAPGTLVPALRAACLRGRRRELLAGAASWTGAGAIGEQPPLAYTCYLRAFRCRVVAYAPVSMTAIISITSADGDRPGTVRTTPTVTGAERAPFSPAAL